MKLKGEAIFIIKTILIILALLIIGKFFIWDEFIESKEKNEIPEPKIIQKVDNNIIDENDIYPLTFEKVDEEDV